MLPRAPQSPGAGMLAFVGDAMATWVCVGSSAMREGMGLFPTPLPQRVAAPDMDRRPRLQDPVRRSSHAVPAKGRAQEREERNTDGRQGKTGIQEDGPGGAAGAGEKAYPLRTVASRRHRPLPKERVRCK